MTRQAFRCRPFAFSLFALVLFAVPSRCGRLELVRPLLPRAGWEPSQRRALTAGLCRHCVQYSGCRLHSFCGLAGAQNWKNTGSAMGLSMEAASLWPRASCSTLRGRPFCRALSWLVRMATRFLLVLLRRFGRRRRLRRARNGRRREGPTASILFVRVKLVRPYPALTALDRADRIQFFARQGASRPGDYPSLRILFAVVLQRPRF